MFCRIPDKATKSEDSMGSGPRDDDSADSSPHRSVSAAEEETDSELEEESSIKPRGTLYYFAEIQTSSSECIIK